MLLLRYVLVDGELLGLTCFMQVVVVEVRLRVVGVPYFSPLACV